MTMNQHTTQTIKKVLRQMGFSVIKIGPVILNPKLKQAYVDWLQQGNYGQMEFLVKQAHHKLDPSYKGKFKSGIVVGVSYFRPKLEFDDFKVALYAQSRDYHKIIGKQLKKAVRELKVLYPDAEWLVSVDWGAVNEKGLGWQMRVGFWGENFLLINPILGSYFFIGVILTSLKLIPTVNKNQIIKQQIKAECMKCMACWANCPTKALGGDGFKAGRCLAYLTIEHKGPIPVDLRDKLNDWLVGCDDCQRVCPHNFNVPITSNKQFLTSSSFLVGLSLKRILMIKDKQSFQQIFAGTPFMRAGWENIIRNACYIAGNQKRVDLIEVLKKWKNQGTPTIKEAAKWAIDKITGKIKP